MLSMLEDKDLQKIEDRLVSRITEAVESSLIPKMVEVFATKEDVNEINKRLDRIEETVANLVTITDELVKRV